MILDRFHSHPHLFEAHVSVPTAERIRFRALVDGSEYIVAEMPRGRSSFLVNLGSIADTCEGVRWQSGGRQPAAPVLFGSGEPLRPVFVDGTTVRAYWQSRDCESVRVQGIHWLPGPEGPQAVRLPESYTPDAADREWAVPDAWVGSHPLELRFTPFYGGRQGRTESLLLPPRQERVEAVFERVMMTISGVPWRRLRVAVRAAPGVTAPVAVQVDWTPKDSGVEPASERREWPPGETSIDVPLENISVRGDRVRVRLEMPGDDTEVAWFAADESGYGPKPADVLLRAGRGADHHEYDYTHANRQPRGHRATILSAGTPLPAVPGLEWSDEPWPTTVLEAYREAAGGDAWGELRSIFSAVTADVREFGRFPQLYQQYAGEPHLRAIARRCGIGPAPFIVEQLRRAGHESAGLNRDAIAAYWLTAPDTHLDRWLGAAAAGASADRLAAFWFHRNWVAPLDEVLRASIQLEGCAAEPLAALRPELIAGTTAHAEFDRAAEAEAVLATPAAQPADFARAAVLRETVLAALAAHWRDALPADPNPRAGRVAELLAERPGTAAAELATLRATSPPAELRRGAWPVFVAETELAARALRDRADRSLRLRAATDWCRVLLDRRVLPVWPWYGLPPDGFTTADLHPLLEAVPPGPPATPPRPDLADAVRQLTALADDLGDAPLAAVAAAFREKCEPLSVWLR